MMTLSLEKQHSIESDLGRDLTESEINEIGEYLNDEPMSADNQYLIDTCLVPDRFLTEQERQERDWMKRHNVSSFA